MLFVAFYKQLIANMLSISHVNNLFSQFMNITYAVIIVCLLESCFMCRNISRGLLCMEQNAEV